ncbi:MAG: hypothetical protein Nk1A_3000 [Endomicrobiia bacterium]|nr:MAG: hypothetical protein Nk1A_3000 [Endomicrobiia bacterium]
MPKITLHSDSISIRKKIQNSKPNKREKVTNRITVQNKNKEFFVTRDIILMF